MTTRAPLRKSRTSGLAVPLVGLFLDLIRDVARDIDAARAAR
ncbi:hypothetical protein [Streptomyces sp. NPDC096132]